MKETKEAPKKSSRKAALIVCCILILCCFVAHYALSGTCDGSNPVYDYFIKTFAPQLGNSGILFTLLWWFGAPMLSKMVKDRKASVEAKVFENGKQKEAAIIQYAEVEAKMKSLKSENASMQCSYREATEVESQRIAEEAKLQAERLKKDAEIAFELQSNVTRRKFENEVMTEAVEKAREEIKLRLAKDSSLRDRLIDQSIASLQL